MAEHSEHSPEGAAAPGDRTTPAGEAPPPAAAEGDRPTAPAAYAAEPPKARPERFRRWSASAPLRLGAVALVAGLVGGLVGGGIVAAFNHDGDDRAVPVRFERGMPRGGPGFRMPRRYFPRGQGIQPGQPDQPRQVPQPVQPPTPSPTTTS